MICTPGKTEQKVMGVINMTEKHFLGHVYIRGFAITVSHCFTGSDVTL